MLVPPTAVQLLGVMQSTEVRTVAPAGLPRSFQSEPPSAVTITWEPVARHVASLEQEMPPRLATPLGTVCGLHVLPPLVVWRIAAPGPPDEEPTAVQWSESAHEIAVKFVTVDGKVSGDHAPPPSVVSMMLGEPDPELKSLTA